MKQLNEIQFTPEFMEQIEECATPEELLQLAKEHDIELSLEEAEQILATLNSEDVDEKTMKKLAGGFCWDCAFDCPGDCHKNCGTWS